MKRKILILCDFNRLSANTIVDHAKSFKKYSRHHISYINPCGVNKPEWINLNKFDAILIHYSIYILGDAYINSTWRESISDAKSLKVLFIQDEYRKVSDIHIRIEALKIDLLFTCFPDHEIDKVYPSSRFPGMKKVSNLTGYVPSYFEKYPPDISKERTIDVGYRGRNIGFWLGALGQEKVDIGKYFLQYTQGHGLCCDISWREEDRIYGKAWLRFQRNCRCVLGTESGASVIDFSGQIEKQVREYLKDRPEATFQEVHNLFFKEEEYKIEMNQISPRIFEAIGCGCCLILYSGQYSGILEPGVHFIELKKDFSNIEDVVHKVKDRDYVRFMAERTYKDVVSSGRYSYEIFVRGVEREIEALIQTRREVSHGQIGEGALRPATKIRQSKIRNLWAKILFFKGLYRLLIRRLKAFDPFFLLEKTKLIVSFLKWG